MPVSYPENLDHNQKTQLANPNTVLVTCLCAAWCNTCTEYQAKFASAAAQFPDAVFVWLDIEDHADYLDDEDIENFPTLLIEQNQQTLFYGTLLPHLSHLTRLLENLSNATPVMQATPLIRQHLLAKG